MTNGLKIISRWVLYVFLYCILISLQGCSPPPGAFSLPVLFVFICLGGIYYILGGDKSYLTSSFVYTFSLLAMLIGLNYPERSNNVFLTIITRSILSTFLFVLVIFGGAKYFTFSTISLYWLFGVFLFIFLLLIGENYISIYKQKVIDDVSKHFKNSSFVSEKLQKRILDCFIEYSNKIGDRYGWHYWGFIISPAVIALLWRYEKIERSFLLIYTLLLSFTIMSLIILTTLLFTSHKIASNMNFTCLENLSTQDIKYAFKKHYELKIIHFLDLSHGLVICISYAIAMYFTCSQIFLNLALFLNKTLIILPIASLPLVLILIPLYIGQMDAINKVYVFIRSNSKENDFDKNIAIKDDLFKIGPPFPSTTSLKHLFLTMTGGGILTVVLSQVLKTLL